MKKYFGKLCMGGVLLFSLSMSLTSCEGALDDILGEWSRPTPGGDGGSSATVTSLTLGKSLRFDKNDLTAQTLTATVTPSDATITWSSDKESVATVDATGKVTPVAPGEATITAKAGDKTATRTVYVYDKIVDISAGNPNVTANESWLINGDGTVVDNPITINDGATVTLNGINISRGIICNGTANIILADGSTNIVDASAQGGEAGIRVGDAPKAFTIDAETAGTGELTVTGGGTYYGGAGIGTRKASGANCGAITIKGGIITATGGGDAAGIGTADASGGDQKCNGIAILGGTVTAIGGKNAAGIGTGNANNSTSINTCGAITINGGTVIATGGKLGAGIGTGNADYSTSTNKCGAITIDAGVTSVTATKGTSSPNSIGQGYNHSSSTQTCGTITIGGVEYWDGSNYKNGGDDATTGLPHSPYIYPAP